MKTDIIPAMDGDLDAHGDNFKAKLTLYIFYASCELPVPAESPALITIKVTRNFDAGT